MDQRRKADGRHSGLPPPDLGIIIIFSGAAYDGLLDADAKIMSAAA